MAEIKNIVEVLNAPSKNEIKNFVGSIDEAIESGNIDPLKLKIKINALKKAVDAVDKSTTLREASLEEARKYAKQESQILGASFQVCETGVKYDYTRSEVWCSFQEQIKTLKEQQKQVEQLAKNTRTVTIYVDEDGVEHTVYPAKKSSTTNLKITLK